MNNNETIWGYLEEARKLNENETDADIKRRGLFWIDMQAAYIFVWEGNFGQAEVIINSHRIDVKSVESEYEFLNVEADLAFHKKELDLATSLLAKTLAICWKSQLRLWQYEVLERLVDMLQELDPPLAVKLFGLVDAFHERNLMLRVPRFRPYYENLSHALQARLGVSTFDALYLSGREAVLDDVVVEIITRFGESAIQENR